MRRARPSRPHLLALAAALLVCGLAGQVPLSSAAFIARVTNSTSTATTATYFTCAAAEVGNAAYFAYPLTESPIGVTAADTSGNGRAGTYNGVVVHSAANSCTRDGGGSATFDGTTSWVATPASTLLNAPQVFTVEIRFRTTSTTGGLLMGFNDSRTAVGVSYDRHLYLTNAGKVVFGVYPNSIQTAISPASYNDGAWHQAIGVLSAAGQKLYVDGALVATNTATSAQSFSGYWRVGWGNLVSWTSQPSSFYFKGELGHAAVYLSALTAAQVTQHYVSGV